MVSLHIYRDDCSSRLRHCKWRAAQFLLLYVMLQQPVTSLTGLTQAVVFMLLHVLGVSPTGPVVRYNCWQVFHRACCKLRGTVLAYDHLLMACRVYTQVDSVKLMIVAHMVRKCACNDHDLPSGLAWLGWDLGGWGQNLYNTQVAGAMLSADVRADAGEAMQQSRAKHSEGTASMLPFPNLLKFIPGLRTQ